MKLAQGFIEEYPNIHKHVPTEMDCWAEGVQVATRHTQRSEFTDLYSISRPHEEQVYVDWRQSNKRHITKAPVDRFVSMLTAAIQSSNVSAALENVPELLGEHLKAKPFVFLGEQLSYDEYVYKCKIPLAIEDTNAIEVVFAINAENPNTPPAASSEEGGLLENQRAFPQVHVITHERRVFVDEDILMYKSEWIKNIGTDKKPDIQPVFIIIDKESYYTYVPTGREKKTKEVIYELRLWYYHGLGKLPFATMPGKSVTKSIPIKTESFSIGTMYKSEYISSYEKIKYKESFAAPAFAYLDEVVVTFSMAQVNVVRHLNPLLVVSGEVACPDCSGSSLVDGDTCKSCNGLGVATDLSQFGILKTRGSSHPSDKVSGDPAKYVTPPEGTLKLGYEIWQTMLDKAEKQLSTDLLEGTDNESGLAKSFRLQPKRELVKAFGDELFTGAEIVLQCMLGILDPNTEEEISIPKPLTYDVKTPELLKLEVTESLPAEREEKFMAYIRAKYSGDDLLVRAYELAICYAPLLLVDNPQEIATLINSGAFNEQDLVKRAYAVKAFKVILGEKDNQEKELKEYFTLADTYLQELGVMPEPALPLIPEAQEEDEEEDGEDL